MTSPAPARRARPRARLRLVRTDAAPLVEAAAGIARVLRSRGLVATGTAVSGEGAGLLVITPGSTRLADRFGIQSLDGTLWLWRAGEPLCQAADPEATADTIAAVLDAVMTAREPRDISR